MIQDFRVQVRGDDDGTTVQVESDDGSIRVTKTFKVNEYWQAAGWLSGLMFGPANGVFFPEGGLPR